MSCCRSALLQTCTAAQPTPHVIKRTYCCCCCWGRAAFEGNAEALLALLRSFPEDKQQELDPQGNSVSLLLLHRIAATKPLEQQAGFQILDSESLFLKQKLLCVSPKKADRGYATKTFSGLACN